MTDHKAYVDDDETGTMFVLRCRECDVVRDFDYYSDASNAVVVHEMENSS